MRGKREAQTRNTWTAIPAANRASCDCMRFTEGDEPPEYAAMRVYIERLRDRDGNAALDPVLERARGPILRQLGRPAE